MSAHEYGSGAAQVDDFAGQQAVPAVLRNAHPEHRVEDERASRGQQEGARLTAARQPPGLQPSPDASQVAAADAEALRSEVVRKAGGEYALNALRDRSGVALQPAHADLEAIDPERAAAQLARVGMLAQDLEAVSRIAHEGRRAPVHRHG